jgi:hypothetical protein
MTIDEFIAQVKENSPPAPPGKVTGFDAINGHPLPDDYRRFLVNCNGGYVGGRYWYGGMNPVGHEVEAGVHHIGGFRKESWPAPHFLIHVI